MTVNPVALKCKMFKPQSQIILSTVVFVLQLNFVLFVNIVRVLLLKLRASVCDETRTYRWGLSDSVQLHWHT